MRLRFLFRSIAQSGITRINFTTKKDSGGKLEI